MNYSAERFYRIVVLRKRQQDLAFVNKRGEECFPTKKSLAEADRGIPYKERAIDALKNPHDEEHRRQLLLVEFTRYLRDRLDRTP